MGRESLWDTSMTDDPHDTVFPLPVWFVIAALFLFGCPGCASTSSPERYLTAEQDAEMRNVCDPHGCQVIPYPAWVQIEAILKRMGAI